MGIVYLLFFLCESKLRDFEWGHSAVVRAWSSYFVVKVNGTIACRRGAHLPFVSHWARRWINHWSLWHMTSETPDLRLPSQLYGIVAVWLVPIDTGLWWWQRHMCVNNLPKVLTWKLNDWESNRDPLGYLHFGWVVDDAKCTVVTRVCVCLSVCLCPRPHAHTTAQTRMKLGVVVGDAP